MALMGQTKDEYQADYLAKKTGGQRAPTLSYKKPGKDKEYMLKKRRRKIERRHASATDAWNKKTAGYKADFEDAFDDRKQTDYSGQNIEKRYGKDVADTIMDAHSAGETGNYERFQTGEEGGIEQLNFGDVAMAAGRVQNRRDLLTNIEEGKFGGGTGLGQSDSGGSGENIFSASSGAQKKKKKSNLLGSGEAMSTARLGYV